MTNTVNREMLREQLLYLVSEVPACEEVSGVINLLEYIQDHIDDEGGVTLVWAREGAARPLHKPEEEDTADAVNS